MSCADHDRPRCRCWRTGSCHERRSEVLDGGALRPGLIDDHLRWCAVARRAVVTNLRAAAVSRRADTNTPMTPWSWFDTDSATGRRLSRRSPRHANGHPPPVDNGPRRPAGLRSAAPGGRWSRDRRRCLARCRSASSSSTSRHDNPNRRYKRTAITTASNGTQSRERGMGKRSPRRPPGISCDESHRRGLPSLNATAHPQVVT